jgi:hypothetical protein
MRRLACLLLVLAAGCGEAPVEAPAAPAPDVPSPTRRRVGDEAVTRPEQVPAAPETPPARDEPDPERVRTLFERLVDPATREAAEADLESWAEADALAFHLSGLFLPHDLALEAAKRLDHTHLDARQSARFVEIQLPYLFDTDERIDFEELRSALGSSEIGAVLQEMREHTDVAGDRTLLGALHRQLRAEHLPALVEMALSHDRRVAEQAFEEIAIVAMYTNRHRRDVARIFAGRAEPPEQTFGVPADLVVSLRAILTDTSLGEVRRSMILAWALRWLRDCKDGGGSDRAFLRELVELARTAPGLGAWERENVQICAFLGLAEKDGRWLQDQLEKEPEAWGEDALVALRTLVLADRDRREARELATADPLALAILLELDPREGAPALFERLRGREPAAALDFVDDLYHARFRFRMAWEHVGRRRLEPGPNAEGLDPALMLRLAVLYPEFDGRRWVTPYVTTLAEPGGLTRRRSGHGDLLWGVLPSIEGDSLREALRAALADGTPDDREHAGEVLALMRDAASEGKLLDGIDSGALAEGLLGPIAEWASAEGRTRVRELLESRNAEPVVRFEARAALGGLPRRVAEPFAERLREIVDDEKAEQDAESLQLLEDGDAVGALLVYLETNPRRELEGIGTIDDPRVVAKLRAWANHPVDRRVHWAIGELALADDHDAVQQIEDVVRVGRYRWVDDASADALLTGSAGRLGIWVQEAESNCCRAVPVKRVFEDGLDIPVTEEMNFQAGIHVTLAEWLAWRLGERDWLDRSGSARWSFDEPDRERGLVWSDYADRYVPSIR